MYPVFFIITYIAGEYIYPTKNGAMMFAFLGAFVFSYVYYTIRSKVRQLTERKKLNKQLANKHLTSLLLVKKDIFDNQFPKNTLTDNSFSGINEEKVIDFLRKYDGDLEIYSVKGITEGAKNFLGLLNKKYVLHTEDEILYYTKNIIPEIELKKEPFYKKFNRAIMTENFRKFAIKYGVILLVLSLITPYKLYYILSGTTLIVFGLLQKKIKKINRRNQIPYLRF